MHAAGPQSPGQLLITGAYRSGTTLLEKLLHNHPDLSVAMQPFPVLFFHAKERFLSDRGLEYRYALDHLFLEDRYAPTDLAAFLTGYEMTAAELDALFERLADYGAYTPGAEDLRDQVAPGGFFDVYYQWDRAVARMLGRADAAWVGNKEIFCEEFIPAFLERGIKVVHIIRDPRDVIASLHFRSRDNQTGDPRPLLFNLRVWRKSAAFALASSGHPAYRHLRYEDLLGETEERLSELTAWLGVPDYLPDAFANGILDQDGSIWRGNSSFSDRSGISRASRGNYRSLVPADTVDYIETLCGPEMISLGYPLEGSGSLSPAALARFEEPSVRVHPLFDPGYSTDPDRLQAESARLSHLAPNAPTLGEDEARKWFIAAGAYGALRGIRPPAGATR
ncbi:MAG: sulfotransferase [Actinobacteria bacterium]|nr:sulfotransferase [Actinomycetota bacterium]MBU1492460.1 sulfotransferase [Actinomycetota bacterium]